MIRYKLHATGNFSGIRTMVLDIAIAILLFTTMFPCCYDFVEAQILPKIYAFILGTVFLCLAVLISTKTPQIIIDSITIYTLIFLLYVLIRNAFGVPNPISIHTISIISFISLYLIFKVLKSEHIQHLNWLIIIVCLLQTSYGILQYTGYLPALAGFSVSGSFDNPCGYAACLAAGFPFCFSLFDKSQTWKCIGLVIQVVIVVGIALSASRAGIIAIAMVLTLHLLVKFHKPNRLKFIILSAAGIIVLLIGLIFLKKDSAVGRLLIWHNSLSMITDKPAFGHGAGGFMAEYMDYQAEYFVKHSDSPYGQLADNVAHPFNEYLLLAVEYGLVGVGIFSVLIILIIRSDKSNIISLLCLISISVFACFSYPLRYPFIWVLAAYSLANIFSKKSEIHYIRVTINSCGKAIWIFTLAGITLYSIIDIKFEFRWAKLAHTGVFFEKQNIILDYEILYSKWNSDPFFLYNYGAILNQLGNYAQSNTVITKCTHYINDFDVQMIIADNYYHLAQYSEAEKHYSIAHYMIPNRFLPLYKLMIVYDKMGDNERAKEVANRIIGKEVKISSQIILHIIAKAQEFIMNTPKTTYSTKQ